MTAQNTKINLLGLSPAKMEEFFADLGEKKFRAQQMLKWIHQFGQSDFEAMTNMSKPLRERLAEVAEIKLPEVVYEDTSKDGTRKWVMRVDGRSEEHTSELQSRPQLVCRLLLETK